MTTQIMESTLVENEWDETLETVVEGDTNVVVTYAGKPVAALIAYEDFEIFKQTLEQVQMLRTKVRQTHQDTFSNNGDSQNGFISLTNHHSYVEKGDHVRRQLIADLVEAGLMSPPILIDKIPPSPLSDEEREELARTLGNVPGKPLSELVIEDRGPY